MLRRLAVPLLVGALGCGGARAPAASPAEQEFHLAPLTDVVAAPKLRWLVHTRPRELYANAALSTLLDKLVSAERFSAFTQRHGLDPRALHELVYARYTPAPGHPPGELWAGRGFVPTARVEAAELAALPYVRQHARLPSGLVRIEGRAASAPVEILLFGHQGGVRSESAPLAARAARAFAEQKLKRSQPALRTGALRELEALLGAAPFRAFAARPDESFARDGLFEHFDALALALTPHQDTAGLWLDLQVAGVGPFGDQSASVQKALQARLSRLDGSRVGRLLGFDASSAWSVTVDERRAEARRRLRAATLLEGLRVATVPSVAELFDDP